MRKIHKTNYRARNIRVWLGIILFFISLAGLVAIDRALQKHAQKITLPEGWQTIRPPHEVSALALQGEVLWAGGKEGVYAIDRSTGAVIKELKHEPGFAYVRALLADDSGRLWIGHDLGLSVFDGKDISTYTQKDGLPDVRVNALHLDKKGKLWVGTWEGLWVRGQGDSRIINKNDGLLENMVNVIFEDKDGGMWFGSYVAPAGGLSFYKNGKWQYFSASSGLPHNNITSITQDKAGDIWVACGLFDRGGAAQIGEADGVWRIKRVFKKEDGLAGEKARSALEDSAGRLWIGSEYDGLAIYENGNWKQVREKDGLCNPEIKVILQDSRGDIWLGTRDGVTRIKNRS